MEKRNRKRPYLHGMRASLTVELTLLMPLIIGVFLFLFFTLYYLHDVAAMQKGCATALTRGALIRDDEEAKVQMQEAVNGIRLLGRWDLERSVSVNKKTVSVRMSGTMKVREGLFLKLIQKKYDYETEESADRIDEVAYIRMHRR